MINEIKSNQLDKILQYLCLDKEKDFSTNQISKDLNLKISTLLYLVDILIKNNVINSIDCSVGKTPEYLIRILPQGEHFLKSEGGFNTIYKNNISKENEEKTLKNLQLAILKSQVENLEKSLNEQSDFWKTSTKKNRHLIWKMWVAIIISIISLIISITN